MSDPRFRTATARLLRVFLAAPERLHYGYDLGRTAELPSGVLYPLLAQLERARWIHGFWEPEDPLSPSRPPRRYYRLTVDGFDSAHEVFEDADGRPAPPPRCVDAAGSEADVAVKRRLAVSLFPAALLQLARLRLALGVRQVLYREWSAELDFALRRAHGPIRRQLALGARWAAGLVCAAARVSRDAGPYRVVPPPDPLGVPWTRRRLQRARRAWDAAARRHAFIDPRLDPVGEALALHAALYCQLEMDEAQLAYCAACAIAAFEQGADSFHSQGTHEPR